MIILSNVGTHGSCVRENDQKHLLFKPTYEECAPTSITFGILADNHIILFQNSASLMPGDKRNNIPLDYFTRLGR